MFRKECFSNPQNQTEINCSRGFKTKNIPFQDLEIKPENFRNDFLRSVKEKDFSNCNVSDIRSIFANDFLNIYLNYKTNQSSATQLFDDFKSLEESFIHLLPENIDHTDDKSNIKHPALTETVTETLTRFSKVETIENILKNQIKGIIIGGSMSYGPFYSVNESSDIDMIIIYDNDLNPELFKDVNFFNIEDKTLFSKRASRFKQLLANDEADVISQKIPVKDENYKCSLHFLSTDILKKIVNQEKDTVVNCHHNMVSVVRNYKENLTHPDYYPTNFAGQTTKFVSEVKKILPDGLITTMHNYIILNDSLYPGFYHSYISPVFSVLYDQDGEIQQIVDSLKEILTNRFILEKVNNPNLKFYYSHPRYPRFPFNLKN